MSLVHSPWRRACRCLCDPLERGYKAYLGHCCNHPAKLLIVWTLAPLVLVALGLLIAGGLPAVETDLSSSAYLRSDGIIGDRQDALGAAMAYEQKRQSSGRLDRRLAGEGAEKQWEEPGAADREARDLEESGGRRLLPQQVEKYYAEWQVDLFYEAKGATIMEEDVLNDIRRLETRILSLPSYTKLCLVEGRFNRECRAPITAMRFFYGSRGSPGAVIGEATEVDYMIYPDGKGEVRQSIPAVLSAMAEPVSWRQLAGQFGRTWYFDQQFPKSKRMRTRLWFGTPLPGFINRLQDREAQKHIFRKFLADELYPVLLESETDRVKVFYSGDMLGELEVSIAVSRDALLALLSLVLVWAYMAFYTRAPLLSVFGMFTVLLGIPVGTILFVMVGNDEFPIINLLALFLLTGIGADHLFVLTDAWRQSEACCKEGDTYARLELSMSRAGKAIVACGTTTGISFMANIYSSIRPLRLFGVYVGLCVFSNFILCLGIFPLVLILGDSGVKPKEAAWAETEETGGQEGTSVVAFAGGVPQLPNLTSSSDLLEPQDQSAPAAFQSRTERFMACSLAPAVRKLRFALLSTGVLMTVGGLVLVSQSLEVSKEPPAFFAPGSHNLGDVGRVRGLYGNGSQWVFNMEAEPIRICKGCQWTGGLTDIYPSGCRRLGSTCEAMPCVDDVQPCADRGVCDAKSGRCSCIYGFTGPDCRQVEGASAADCGVKSFGGEACNGNGVCNRATCWCNKGWTGEFCQVRDGAVELTDCQWSTWGLWSGCSATCGWGQYYRNRIIKEPAREGGNPCDGRPMETKECKPKDCDVDCRWGNWTAWGSCSAMCGDGTQERTRTMADEARGMGASCQGSATDVRTCSEAACPCDTTPWKNDGGCSATCGDAGVQRQVRTVSAADPSKPGSCPVDETTQFLPCNRVQCPQTCSLGPWQEDPSGNGCSAACGEGKVRQVRDALGGDSCPSAASPERVRTVDCIVAICESSCAGSSYGDWKAWGACSAACGASQRTRQRTGQAGCDDTEQVQACSKPACPRKCESFLWQNVGQCSATCGLGAQLQQRNFQGTQGTSDCPAERSIGCAAGKECPVDCVLGTWAGSSPCSVTCGSGLRVQARTVLQYGAHGGLECPATSSPERSRTEACEAGVPCTEIEDLPDFNIELHGGAQTMSVAEAEALRNAIAQYLKVPVSSVVTRTDSLGGGRRLQKGGTRQRQQQRQPSSLQVSVLVEGTPEADQIAALQAAINSYELVNKLKESGFSGLTHVTFRPTSSSTTTTMSPAAASQAAQSESTTALPWQIRASPAPPPLMNLPQISAADRALPSGEVAKINILFGITADKPTGAGGTDKGKPVRDLQFDLTRYSAQAAISRVCEAAKAMGDRLAIRSAICIVEDFEIYLQTQGKSGWPVVPGKDVHELLLEFLNVHFRLEWVNMVGSSDDGTRVVWIRLEFRTNLPSVMPATQAWAWNAEWNKFLDEMNRQEASSGVGLLFHTSDLWVRAETETKLVFTTLMCAVFSIFFSLVAVVIFLRNLALAVYLILCIVCVVTCLAAVMFGIIGWPFGAVEAIGLIVFVGFSVDYSMHLAEAFRQSKHETRYLRTQEALRRTGGAIFASATTSILAGMPILGCTIQVFVKFGITVVSNTVLSLLFSVFFFSALLMIAGPLEDPCAVLLCAPRSAVTGTDAPGLADDPNSEVVVGTVIAATAGTKSDEDPTFKKLGAGERPVAGYFWSSGDNDEEETPKKGDQDSSPVMPASPSSPFNENLSEPTRCATPSRGNTQRAALENQVQPSVLGIAEESDEVKLQL